MSSIVLTNPFVPTAPPAQGAPEGAAATALPPLAAAEPAGDSARSGTAAEGDQGAARQAERVDLLRAAREALRPPDATGGSVIRAQSQEDPAPPPPLGANLPKVAMPDPLPTSPFLKRG